MATASTAVGEAEVALDLLGDVTNADGSAAISISLE